MKSLLRFIYGLMLCIISIIILSRVVEDFTWSMPLWMYVWELILSIIGVIVLYNGDEHMNESFKPFTP